MENLDMIESRVSALEEKILGQTKNEEPKRNFSDLKPMITDTLLEAQTMITSALSCRDSIGRVMDKMVRVDEYLDPLYVAQIMDVECKMTYILEMHEKLNELHEKLKIFDKLLVVLDSENIKKLLENGETIQITAAKTSEVNELSISTLDKIMKLLVGYDDMMKNVQHLFRQMNLLLTNLEEGQEYIFEKEE